MHSIDDNSDTRIGGDVMRLRVCIMAIRVNHFLFELCFGWWLLGLAACSRKRHVGVGAVLGGNERIGCLNRRISLFIHNLACNSANKYVYIGKQCDALLNDENCMQRSSGDVS